MTGKGKDAVVIGLVFAASAMLMASGCGRLRLGITDGRRDRPIESSSGPQAPAPGTESTGQEAALAAVEEFLKRTEEYQLADATSGQTIPQSAAAAELTTRIESEATPDSPVGAPGPASRHTPPRDQAFANAQVTLTDAPSGVSELALPVIQSVSIRIPTPVAAPSEDQAPTKTTNQPLDMQTPIAPMTVDGLLRHLELQAEEEADFDAEWQLRLTQLAFDRDTEMPEVSSEVSPGARSILDAVIKAVDAARRVARNPLAAGKDAVSSAEELVHVLADRADPIVPTVALCRKVVTFGVYDEMGEEAFIAGRTARTIVYCEVRNFRSERTSENLYRTVLGTRLEVLTADGQSVWQHEEPEIVDLCRRQRTDFFIAQRTTLPPTLAAGDYVLKVLVEDKLSGKANEATHPFSVGSPTSVAASR